MLQSSTLKFLKELKKNNNKPWFDEHRKQYELVKTDFYSFVDALITGISKFDPPIGNLKAKDCAFRINRDVRFSKDKSPYKNNIAGYFNRNGKKGNGAGYYLHIEPGKSFAAGGLWMPDANDLAKIRQEIDYSFDKWKKIVTHKTFKKYFTKGVEGTETLSRPPKGYDENNPAIAFLKMKGFIVSHPFDDAALQNKPAVTAIVKNFEAMKPMVDFLNAGIE